MKKLLAALAVTAGVLLMPMLGQATYADEIPAPPVELDVDDTSTIVLAAPVVTIIVSLLIPIVNGYLTKSTTPSKIKAIGTIVANAVMGVIAVGVLTDGTAVLSATTLYTAGIGAAISILSYLGLYSPMGLTSSNRFDKASGEVVPGKLSDKGLH